MKKLLVLPILILGVVGCNPICNVEKVVSEKLVSVVAAPQILNCSASGQQVMQSDLEEILNLTKICDVVRQHQERSYKSGKPTGGIANIVCPIVVSTAVSMLGNAVPASWECNPTVATETLSTALMVACQSLPF